MEDGVCGVCGGPRIPKNLGGEPAALALKDQKRHLDAARKASITTVVGGALSVLVALVTMVAMPSALLARVLLFAVAAAPLLLAVRSRSRAARARAAATEAGERAWLAAAEELAQGGTTAKKLAQALSIEPGRAERLLTASAARSRVRIDVDAAGEDVVFRADERLSTDEYPALEDEPLVARATK